MKKFVFIVFLLPASVWAQTDTLRVKADTLLDTRKLDSLQHSFAFTHDSLKQSYAKQTQKLTSLRQRYVARLDSVKATSRNPLDTVSLLVTADVYTQKIDSLTGELARVQQQTTARIDSLKGNVSRELDKLKLPKEAQGKVAGLTAAMNRAELPALPAGMPELPEMGNVPSAELPGVKLPDVHANLPDAKLDVPGIQSTVPNVRTDKLNDLTGQAGDIQQQVKEATGSVDGLGKTLEGKASEQVKGLPHQKLPDVAGIPGGVPPNGDAMKEQLTELAKKEAVNHFDGKEAALTGAMEKMAKYKQQYSSVSSLKDIKDEKRHNELKGKPLRERLVPALTLQFQSWEDFMLDINPSVGYRFTSHLTGGIGWNQRVAFNLPRQQFNAEANVYGIRTYGEYTFKKGFGFRLDVETMNTPAKKKDPATDVAPPRDWVWGALVGIKQKYPIYKKLKGNAQLMYNLFDKDHRSPYRDRVNWRMGIEFTLKKKKKTNAK